MDIAVFHRLMRRFGGPAAEWFCTANMFALHLLRPLRNQNVFCGSAGIIGTAISMLVAKPGLKADGQDRTQSQEARAIMSMQTSADKTTTDALIQTMAALEHSINGLNVRMDHRSASNQAKGRATR